MKDTESWFPSASPVTLPGGHKATKPGDSRKACCDYCCVRPTHPCSLLGVQEMPTGRATLFVPQRLENRGILNKGADFQITQARTRYLTQYNKYSNPAPSSMPCKLIIYSYFHESHSLQGQEPLTHTVTHQGEPSPLQC